LEYELQIANSKFNEYESVINSMEQDMLNIQKAWYPQQEHQTRITIPNFETKSIQVTMETQVVSVQTDPYICCLNKKVDEIAKESNKETDKETIIFQDIQKPKSTIEKTIEKTFREVGNNTEESTSSVMLNEQLDQALKLASERSAMLVKCESQLSEYKLRVDALNKMITEKDSQYQAKVDTLNKAIEKKDSHFAQKQNVLDELTIQPRVASTDCALKSTINSLQKLINQKEETILRYQNLLKEDRDEHSRAASRFQDEIKNLHDILAMQSKIRKSEDSIVTIKNGFEKPSTFDETTARSSAVQEEEIARLHEKISTFEAELNISKELSERWHRLAEERLNHMDHMRERFV